MEAFFDFEKPIVTLEKKLQDLQELARQEGVDFAKEIRTLEKKVLALIDETYSKLTPWQRVQLSRHPMRPYSRDYIDMLFPDFMELRGDRAFGDDQAILAGFASWPPVDPLESLSRESEDAPAPEKETKKKASATTSTRKSSVLILGHQKGRTTKQKMERNFGMARPEGYRKAMRLMTLADRLKVPVITFIDTPGAYPGLEAEARGQSQAIAESIHLMFGLKVPVVSVVIGEGGSGGALAIGVANRVLMQEFSTYSVISPESCASILWSDSTLAERASEKLKMNPNELLRLKVIDAVVPEPKGGAHRNPIMAASLLRKSLIESIESATKSSTKGEAKLAGERLAKFREMGSIALAKAPSAEADDAGP